MKSMRRVKKFIKSNIKTGVAFIIGLVLAGGSAAVVYAISGSQVTYTDTNNIGATTVQDAIDKLYTGITTYKNMVCPECVYRKSSTTKYNRNASSATDSNAKLTSSEYTTDYTTLNSNYFLGHVIDSSGNILASYACGINNGVFFCLRGVDSSQSSLTYKPFYEENVKRMKQVFSGCKATTSLSNANCDGGVTARVSSNGDGYVISGSSNCAVFYNGSSSCWLS